MSSLCLMLALISHDLHTGIITYDYIVSIELKNKTYTKSYFSCCQSLGCLIYRLKLFASHQQLLIKIGNKKCVRPGAKLHLFGVVDCCYEGKTPYLYKSYQKSERLRRFSKSLPWKQKCVTLCF